MSSPVDAAGEVRVPAPVVTDENAGFWAGVNEGEFRLARCQACGDCSLEDEACVRCGAFDRRWQPASTAGTLKSYVVFRRAYHEYWATQVPYNVCIVALEAGPDLLTNIVDVTEDQLRVGMDVRVVIRPRGEYQAPVAIPAPAREGGPR